MSKGTIEQLPGVSGPGVSALSIPAIDKLVTKYENKKNERCKISPAEVAAKQELFAALQKHREKLHVDAEGKRFYRVDGVDYYLEESLKRRKVDAGGGDEGD